MKRIICVLAAVSSAACAKEASQAPSAPNTPPPAMEKMFDDHWTTASPSGKGPAILDPADVREGRTTRRLTIDQLRRSIPALFDGITWTARARGADIPVFDLLSRTLGEADYIQVTETNSEPSPLFAKFMDDMAGDVCYKAVTADAAKAADARTVTPYASDVDRNLRFLRLKLHAISVPEGSTEGLEDYRKLYDDVVADTRNQDQAWMTVCVAMLTAPEFMSY